jgi:hypothetical protein
MTQLHQFDRQQSANVVAQLDIGYLFCPVLHPGSALLLGDAGEPAGQLSNAPEPWVRT